MTMRVSKITTYLRLEDAHTIIEFLDQLREMLIATYGDVAGSVTTCVQSTPPDEWRDERSEIG